MKKLYISLFIIVIAIAISFYLNTTTDSISDSIVIALIGALTATTTIIGSVYVNQQLAVANARQQREMEIRKSKQEYYHKFTESFTQKLIYSAEPKSRDFKEADIRFCIERSRLPLYASQELIEWVDSVAKGESQDVSFTVLYNLIRDDLANNEFKTFVNLKAISVTLPRV